MDGGERRKGGEERGSMFCCGVSDFGRDTNVLVCLVLDWPGLECIVSDCARLLYDRRT